MGHAAERGWEWFRRWSTATGTALGVLISALFLWVALRGLQLAEVLQVLATARLFWLQSNKKKIIELMSDL